MAEYFSSNEFKRFDEHKRFEAEVYLKPTEYKSNIPEIASTGAEVYTEQQPKKSVKKKTDENESKRSKIKKFFDSIKNSTARTVGTVSTTVVVGASVIIVASSVISSPEVEDTDTTPPPPPIVEEFAPEYSAILNMPLADEITVLWENENNVIKLNNFFEQGADSACAYRITVRDETGEVLSSFIGTESSIEIAIPTEITGVTLQYEEIYREQDEITVFETKTTELISFKAPEITFLDNKTLKSQGKYLIPYVINSALSEKEEYSELLFNVSYDGITDAYEVKSVIINEQAYLEISLPSEATELTVSATLSFKGAYGGNPRRVTSERTYENAPEIYVSSYYVMQNSALWQEEAIELYLKYTAPQGSYLVLLDNLTGAEQELYIDTMQTIYGIGASGYDMTLILMSEDGQELARSSRIYYESVADVGSEHETTFNYKNPNEIVITYNDDGTINMYLDTSFSSSTPGVYYQVMLGGSNGYTAYTFNEPLAAIEGIANESYAVVYYVCRNDSNGSTVVLEKIAVSGTTSTPFAPVYSERSSGGIDVVLSFGYDEIGENLTLIVNGAERIAFKKSDFVYNEETYEYRYTLPYEGEVLSLNVEAHVSNNSQIYDEITNKYGSEIIKGEKYALYVTE